MDRTTLLARIDAGPLDRRDAEQIARGRLEAWMLVDAANSLRGVRQVLPPSSPAHEAEAAAVTEYREALIALALRMTR